MGYKILKEKICQTCKTCNISPLYGYLQETREPFSTVYRKGSMPFIQLFLLSSLRLPFTSLTKGMSEEETQGRMTGNEWAKRVKVSTERALCLSFLSIKGNELFQDFQEYLDKIFSLFYNQLGIYWLEEDRG